MADDRVQALQNLVTELSARVVELEHVLQRVHSCMKTVQVPSYVRHNFEKQITVDADTINAVTQVLQETRPPLSEAGTIVDAYAVREAEIRRAVQALEDFIPDQARKEQTPFFSETFLYELVGKDDARSVLSRFYDLREALRPGRNMVRDPRGEVLSGVLKSLERDINHYAHLAKQCEERVKTEGKKASDYDRRKVHEYRGAADALRTAVNWLQDDMKRPRREPKRDD